MQSGWTIHEGLQMIVCTPPPPLFFFTLNSLFFCVSPPAATHSQIMLLHSLKKANYQLPLLITDSGVPPLSNSTEVKVQVCVCKKNKMHCSSAHSHRASLVVLLATLLLALLCKYQDALSTGVLVEIGINEVI